MMAANTNIQFKVFVNNGDINETKRFSVDSGAVTSFMFIKEKLLSVFPSLRDVEFKITWNDSEGDHISITNDEDVITALTEMNESVKVLYINVVNHNKNMYGGRAHIFQVTCDICNKCIQGYRYKCLECPDYDLCATCESEGHHAEHFVLRLPNSDTPIARVDRKIMYNAAHALKKSAFKAARESHRFAREASRSDKHCRGDGPNTSNQRSGCPYVSEDSPLQDIISQHLNPLLEMINHGAPDHQTSGKECPAFLSDVIRTAVDAFFGNKDPSAPSTNNQENASESSPAEPTSDNNKEQETDKGNGKETSQQAAETETKNSHQEMDWTILNNNQEPEVAPQVIEPQIPQPPQDLRLMRGLAQLHEMGFSNENNFLNYLLQTHDYNVADVVKSILEMR